MPVVLLVEPDGASRTYLAEVLGRSDWEVRTPADAEMPPPDLLGAEVVVSDLRIAIAQGWIRARGAGRPSVPLVVTSAFATFLEQVRSQVSAVLALPATETAVVAAMRRASGQPVDLVPDPERIDILADSKRRQALLQSGVLDPALEPELARVAELVARGVEADMGIVTAIDANWQTYLGQTGLPTDLAIAGGTPASWSFCQHVVREGATLLVEDATEHPVLCESPLVKMGLVCSYAGALVEVEGLGRIGAVCVISSTPRAFSRADVSTIRLGAELAKEIFTRRIREAPPRSPHLSPYPDDGSARRELAPGDSLDDKYWITARLGAGGQSRVYLARDKLLGQLVAIKITTAFEDPALFREAEALARLRHMNIVQLHGWGKTPAGDTYLVLEYVPGESLDQRIDLLNGKGEKLPAAVVTDIVRQLAGALASMHALGFLHGDLKPSNVMLDRALDRAVLIDFGLGLVFGEGADVEVFNRIGGTPGFSAPEHLSGISSDPPQPASDTYALAAVAHTMLTGTPPFEAPTFDAILARQLRSVPNKLRRARPELSGEVEDLFTRALSRNPWQRPTSPIAFAELLDRALRRPGGAHTPITADETVPMSRGAAFRAVRLSALDSLGADGEHRLLRSLPARERAMLDQAMDDRRLYPAMPLVLYLRELTGGDRERLSLLGKSIALHAMRDAVRRLQIARTPETLIEVSPALFRRFHAWGSIQTKRTASQAERVLLTLPADFAPIMCAHLGGVLLGLLAMAGVDAKLDHAACMADGAASCALDVSWKHDRSWAR